MESFADFRVLFFTGSKISAHFGVLADFFDIFSFTVVSIFKESILLKVTYFSHYETFWNAYLL